MDEKIDTALEKVLGMIRTNMTPEEAMKVTQAAHNLAHVKSLLAGVKQSLWHKPKGKDPTEV